MKLTNEQQQVLLIEVERALYKKSYFEFFLRCTHELEPSVDWKIGWYHQYLCDILQKEAERINRNEPKTTDYCISIPPRSSKSLLFSSVFNSWLWLYFPQQKILSLSYSDELSGQLAYQTKLIFELPWYKKLNNSFTLDKSNNSKTRFYNDKMGGRFAAGLQGSVTGFGGDWVLVDDAAKSTEIGELKRNNVINQYKNTIYNRLNNPKVGVRIVIGQRLHSLDLIGWCNENLNNVTYISLPAKINNSISPKELVVEYEKRMGYLLPELFDEQVLEEYRIALGSYGYSAQYEMNPVPVGGGQFKYDWFDALTLTAEHQNIIWNIYVDSAYGKKGGDYTGIVVAGSHNNTVIIKKAYQLQLEFPALVEEIKRIHTEHCNVQSKVMIEPKASGISLIQAIRKMTMLNVQEIKDVKDDKITRAHAISPIAECHRVFIVDGMWNTKFLDEVCNFPLAANDDMTDAFVYAVDDLLNKTVVVTYISQKRR
jgi:predicted phage terminase large subunit-like protein